LPKKTDLKRG